MKNTYGDREGRLRILLSKTVVWAWCVNEETVLEKLIEQEEMRLERLFWSWRSGMPVLGVQPSNCA